MRINIPIVGNSKWAPIISFFLYIISLFGFIFILTGLIGMPEAILGGNLQEVLIAFVLIITGLIVAAAPYIIYFTVARSIARYVNYVRIKKEVKKRGLEPVVRASVEVAVQLYAKEPGRPLLRYIETLNPEASEMITRAFPYAMETKLQRMKRVVMNHINKGHKRNTMVVLAILSLCVMMTLTAHAAEAETIGTIVYDGDIYIYVRGVSAIQPDSVIQIGNTVCPAEQISVASFDDLENCIRTLILVDNSKSVPEKNRADIQEILHQFSAESMPNEQIRVGTFSQDITYLCEYTNNQENLDGVIDGIIYNDQDTYLGYALYTAVSQIKEEQTPLCTRIIILADGADEQSIGYPNEEVRTYIEKAGIPVYSIGIPSKKNTSELETMFSFSRAAKADSFLLDGSISNEEIVHSLQMDTVGVCIRITPDESLKDGSTKRILLKLNTAEGAYELTTSADMPFGTGEIKESEKEIVIETESVLPVLNPTNSADHRPDANVSKETVWVVAALITIAVILLMIAVLLILIFAGRKKKKTQETPGEEPAVVEPVKDSNQTTKTIYDINCLDDNALNLWNNQQIPLNITLRRMDDPNIFYKAPIKEIVRIGRENADIMIPDPKVSRLHCQISRKDAALFIKDCNSSNGTYYKKVAVTDEVAIVDGEELKVGSCSYRIEIEYKK